MQETLTRSAPTRSVEQTQVKNNIVNFNRTPQQPNSLSLDATPVEVSDSRATFDNSPVGENNQNVQKLEKDFNQENLQAPANLEASSTSSLPPSINLETGNQTSSISSSATSSATPSTLIPGVNNFVPQANTPIPNLSKPEFNPQFSGVDQNLRQGEQNQSPEQKQTVDLRILVEKQSQLIKQLEAKLTPSINQNILENTQKQITSTTNQSFPELTPNQERVFNQQIESQKQNFGQKAIESLKGIVKNPVAKKIFAGLLIAGGVALAGTAILTLGAAATVGTGILGASGSFGTYGFLGLAQSGMLAPVYTGLVGLAGTAMLSKGLNNLKKPGQSNEQTIDAISNAAQTTVEIANESPTTPENNSEIIPQSLEIQNLEVGTKISAIDENGEEITFQIAKGKDGENTLSQLNNEGEEFLNLTEVTCADILVKGSQKELVNETNGSLVAGKNLILNSENKQSLYIFEITAITPPEKQESTETIDEVESQATENNLENSEKIDVNVENDENIDPEKKANYESQETRPREKLENPKDYLQLEKNFKTIESQMQNRLEDPETKEGTLAEAREYVKLLQKDDSSGAFYALINQIKTDNPELFEEDKTNEENLIQIIAECNALGQIGDNIYTDKPEEMNLLQKVGQNSPNQKFVELGEKHKEGIRELNQQSTFTNNHNQRMVREANASRGEKNYYDGFRMQETNRKPAPEIMFVNLANQLETLTQIREYKKTIANLEKIQTSDKAEETKSAQTLIAMFKLKDSENPFLKALYTNFMENLKTQENSDEMIAFLENKNADGLTDIVTNYKAQVSELQNSNRLDDQQKLQDIRKQGNSIVTAGRVATAYIK